MQLVREMVWENFFEKKRGWEYFSNLVGVDHLACRLLRQYRHRGTPVFFLGHRWMEGQGRVALERGPHQSTMVHVPFLWVDFASMVGKGQWVVLPYSVAKEIQGLRLIPPGVKEERDWRPRRLLDYSYIKLNSKTLPIAALSAMQYIWDLDRPIREIVIADPTLGPVHVLKADVIDGFYRIG